LELDIYVAENDKGLCIRGQFAENLVEGELIFGNGNMPTGPFEFDVAFPSWYALVSDYLLPSNVSFLFC